MNVDAELAALRLKARTEMLSEALDRIAPRQAGRPNQRPPAAFGGAVTPYGVRQALGLPPTASKVQARGLVACCAIMNR